LSDYAASAEWVNGLRNTSPYVQFARQMHFPPLTLVCFVGLRLWMGPHQLLLLSWNARNPGGLGAPTPHNTSGLPIRRQFHQSCESDQDVATLSLLCRQFSESSGKFTERAQTALSACFSVELRSAFMNSLRIIQDFLTVVWLW
jgi:hypothetical protein